VIHSKYSRNWTKQVPEVLFYPEASKDPKRSRRGATGDVISKIIIITIIILLISIIRIIFEY
jgi:hypothetical protein